MPQSLLGNINIHPPTSHVRAFPLHLDKLGGLSMWSTTNWQCFNQDIYVVIWHNSLLVNVNVFYVIFCKIVCQKLILFYRQFCWYWLEHQTITVKKLYKLSKSADWVRPGWWIFKFSTYLFNVSSLLLCVSMFLLCPY